MATTKTITTSPQSQKKMIETDQTHLFPINKDEPKIKTIDKRADVENIELTKIAKLYKDLSLEHKKKFFKSLITVFDEKSLRKLNSDLESLRHYDLRFKLDKDYKNIRNKISGSNYDYRKQSIVRDLKTDESNCKQLVKLPTIIEQNAFKTLAQLSVSTQFVKPETSEHPSIDGNLSRAISSSNIKKSTKFPSRPIDIDLFIRKKNMHIVNKPWSINKSLMVSKSPDLGVTLINHEATKILINKLKSFIREKYLIEADNDLINSYNSFNSFNTLQANKQNTPWSTTINDFMSNSINTQLFPSNIKSSKSESISLADPNRIRSSQLSIYKNLIKENSTDLTNNTIYLKKFKNNYYDRKLWYTLLNNSSINDTITSRAITTNTKSFNFYADNSVRDYNNEFNILNKFDSNETNKVRSIFSRTNNSDLKQSTVSSRASITNSQNEPVDKLTKFQESILQAKNQSLNTYLVSILNYIPIIKSWSLPKKLSLFLMLIENDSDKILAYFTDLVKKKAQPVETDIDHLPDNVLLTIFLYLNDETLNIVEKVCQRWHYLANTTEFWFFKCKEILLKEKLTKKEMIVFYEFIVKNEDMDLKLVYDEINKFLAELKTHQRIRQSKITDRRLKELKSPSSSTIPTSYQSKYSKLSYLSSYDNYYKPSSMTKEYHGNEGSTKSNSKVSFQSRPIRILTRKSNDSKQIFSIQEAVSDYFTDNEDDYLYEEEEEEEFNNSNLEAGFEEVKMELVQTKDLLKKNQPNFKLRWKLRDENQYNIPINEKIYFSLAPITQVKSIKDHHDTIICMDYDKRRLVTGSLDRLILAYDIRNLSFIGKLEGHKGGIRCLQLYGNRLCSGSWDMTVCIWNLVTFELVVTILSFTNTVSCLYFDKNYLICGSHDKTIKVWKFNQSYKENLDLSLRGTIQLKQSDVILFHRDIKHHDSQVTCLEYDGIENIISANAAGIILIISINGVLLNKLFMDKYLEPITCLKLWGSLILTTTNKGKVMFWNRHLNKCESIIECHNTSINSLVYFQRRFYTAANDCLIKEWELSTLTCLRHFKAHSGPVSDMISLGTRLISCGSDRVIVWEMGDRGKNSNKNNKK